jgi:putative flavoprotein involved in K+ transport
MTTAIEERNTVIVGGGPAGLAMSHLLSQYGIDHVVLEKERRIGETWRRRWDSFTLVTPNWQLQLPGYPYGGDDPDGFLTRDQVVAYLESYAAHIAPPLRFGVTVTGLSKADDNTGYYLRTNHRTYEATNVVVAAGAFQYPNIPPCSEYVSKDIRQIPSSSYRNPESLPDGNVLVVGSGQTGCQIAQELNESGRRVYLSTSSVRRLPRRYRGKDSMWWAMKLGMTEQTVDSLESPAQRFEPNPQISGKDGGQDINLHQFARDGIVLLGHLEDIHGRQAKLSPNMHENLGTADKSAAMFREGVDTYIEKNGLNIPEETVEEPHDGYEHDERTALDLADAGITTIIWATGFGRDYSWIQLPILDEYGYPIQQRGVTEYPGLYFIGLHFMHTLKSGLFLGMGEDARHVATHIIGKEAT